MGLRDDVWFRDFASLKDHVFQQEINPPLSSFSKGRGKKKKASPRYPPIFPGDITP